MAKIRAAIVGAGLIAGKKHIPAFLKLRRGVELVALCDSNTQAAGKLGDRFGIARTYSSLSEMLAKEQPDLVDICTPPQTHARLAVEAINRGCHVMIEKPMAVTVAECEEIVHASREAGVKVCVAHSDLFYHAFMKARECVRNGEIGDFRGMRIFLCTPTDYMTSQKDHWAHRLEGGVVGETGPHAVYMTLAFINPIREVKVLGMKILDYPWSAYEDYRMELVGDKAISSVALCYASDQWMARVDLLGSEGALLVDLQGLSLVKYQRPALSPRQISLSLLKESSRIFLDTLANGARFTTGRLRTSHDILIGKFVDSIANGAEPPVTVEEGKEAVRVMKMIADELAAKASESKDRSG